MSEPERPPEITDPHSMRALAHPVRLRLLDALRQEGELTASRAAEMLGESPGNMSWHLKTLAKYGFVEETGTGKGRSRPWRQVQKRFSFNTVDGDPEATAAGEALEGALEQQSALSFQRWRQARPDEPLEWRHAELGSYSTLYLSAEELIEIGDALEAIVARYKDRDPIEARAEGRRAVRLTAYGYPLV